jgi:hypothetical protein
MFRCLSVRRRAEHQHKAECKIKGERAGNDGDVFENMFSSEFPLTKMLCCFFVCDGCEREGHFCHVIRGGRGF